MGSAMWTGIPQQESYEASLDCTLLPPVYSSTAFSSLHLNIEH
jgi:hypothetical protein